MADLEWKKARVPLKFQAIVNRINVLQIVSYGLATRQTMKDHLKRVCYFYSQAAPFLRKNDLRLLRVILLDFYALLGIYSASGEFIIHNLDSITTIEWCTVKELEILMNTYSVAVEFEAEFASLDRLREANRLIMITYYPKHAHTMISTREMKREIIGKKLLS